MALAGFHDDLEVVRIGHRAQVFQRVAIDQQQVYVGTFLDHAQIAFRIGVAQAAELEERSGGIRRHPQDLDR